MAALRALIVASYEYSDTGLRRLAAPAHDAEAFADVLRDPEIAGFEVATLINQSHHVVGEAIADFYAGARRDDLTLLYFSGHGLKDDEGRLYLAMINTRREALMFTAISAAQLNDAMEASPSRRKVLLLDCCYSGAFPPGRTAKADEGVQTLERFQGKGRAVLTASDSTQYAFEGDEVRGAATSSVFTRYLVEAIRSGAADLDDDGDIALDELYSYVYEKVVAEVPQQRPKKQEDVDGRILIARNVHWTLPTHLRHAIESPIAAQRLSAVEGLEYLHQAGNSVVRATVAGHLAALAADDSRSVASAASAALERAGAASTGIPSAAVAPERTPASASAPVSVGAPQSPASPKGASASSAPRTPSPLPPVKPPPHDAPTGAAAAPDPEGPSGTPGRRTSRRAWILAGLGGVVLVGILIVAMLAGRDASTESGGGGIEVDATPATSDDLELTDLAAVSRRDPEPPSTGDTVTVSYSLTNVGEQPLELAYTFVGVRDPEDNNEDAEDMNEGVVLPPGETIDAQGRVPLDSAGTWEVWPCYELSDGTQCPDKWQVFFVVVD
jgi:hypothetical protein